MSRTLRFQLLAVALVTLAAVGVLMRFRIVRGVDLAGGAELRYKVLFQPGFNGDPSQATRDTADIVRRRLTGNALREPKIHAEGRDGILIQLPGVDGDGLQDQKRLIAPMGKLQFFAAAATELQER